MKIEEGKYYRTRDGARRGPMSRNDTSINYPWVTPGGSMYTAEGRYDLSTPRAADLVSEWVDETPSGGPEPDKYEPLRRVLDAAYEQAASGKGSARHANGRPFLQQPILENTRQVGLAGPVFQVMKKAQEAVGMAARGETAAAKAELYGAIVYAAAAVLFLEETENDA